MTLPPPAAPFPSAAREPEPVPGLAIVHEDEDIVVVDKPAGVAAHPTPGWTGPTVLQGLLAAGHTLATSGAAERQGIVHRLDAGTSGADGGGQERAAYSALKRAFREREVDKRYHALVQGHPDPLRGTVDAPIGRHPSGDGRFAVVADGRPRSPTTTRWRRSARRAWSRSTWRPAAHPPDPGAHGGDQAPLRRATGSTEPIRCWPQRLGLTRQWLHAVRLGFAHPADGRRVEFTSEYPPDLTHALEVLRAES